MTSLDIAEDDWFGSAVSLAGNVALVGAVHENKHRGAAYVFTFDGATWEQQAKLTVKGAKNYDQFGSSVALSGRTAFIGAQHFRDPGKVYEFSLRGNTWKVRAILAASDGANGDTLGATVAVSGQTVLAGAPDIWNAVNPQKAYIFNLSGDGQ